MLFWAVDLALAGSALMYPKAGPGMIAFAFVLATIGVAYYLTRFWRKRRNSGSSIDKHSSVAVNEHGTITIKIGKRDLARNRERAHLDQ